jgi:hypothetical protein
MRETSRGFLRVFGSFHEAPAYISAAFNAATPLEHCLGEDAIALIIAQLRKVFPYYISGYKGVMPNLTTFEDLSAMLRERLSIPNDASFPWFEGASGIFSGVTAPYLTKGPDDSSSDDVDVYATLAIDAVVREVGFEALCSLASTPGILASMYQVTDCSLSYDDVVTNLLLSLAGATTLRLLRR